MLSGLKLKKSDPKEADRQRYRRYLKNEIEAVQLYRDLASVERDQERASLFRRLAQAEMRHVRIWSRKLGLEDQSPDDYRRTLRVITLRSIAWAFGTRAVMPMVLKAEAADASTYREDPEASNIVQEEVEHFNVLGRLSGLPDHLQIISLERRHYSGTVNVRAGVLGFNDGLISNVSLVMGVAGATADATFIVIAGISGLLAGAFSMAAGEYVSVRAQRDVYEREIEVERAELEEVPREEMQELALIYQRKGFTRQEARMVAERIISNPEVALETLAREELGLDPDQLGNPWVAAVSSFLAFAFGALIPLLPNLFSDGMLALVLTIALGGSATFGIGALLGTITGKNLLWGGARMLLVGTAAAGVTYGIGSAIGLSLDL
jgi:VIT1/CCC1 family predicted Fe2+/Mn2+ transporter